ncbi:MAG: site-specific integrase [Clostridia bacterium]|nr:site-specific integrase [Clostridia bacterium]
MPSYPTRKTKNGTVTDVRFRIIDENGQEAQRRLCGYQNKRAAQQAYLDFMKTYTPPTFQLKKDGVYTFDELFSLYKRKMEAELAVSSYYDLNWIFDKYITPYFSGKSIPTLKKADYTLWQTELWATKNPKTGEFYKKNYLSKIRTTLMTFLTWCEDTFDIPNQYAHVKKPKRKEMKTEMEIWELNEFTKFQNTVDDIVWKTFFMSLFYTGCRVGELLAPSDSDVIKENGNYFISIRKGLTRKTANTEDKYLITAPKTSTSNRKIQLPEVLAAQLEEYLTYKKENGIPSAFLFGGESPIPQRTYQRYFERYTKAAELKHIRIHDLRHSHASMLIHLNVPITVISKRLGHSSVKMTLEKYSHCYSDDEDIAISAINNITIN